MTEFLHHDRLRQIAVVTEHLRLPGSRMTPTLAWMLDARTGRPVCNWVLAERTGPSLSGPRALAQQCVIND